MKTVVVTGADRGLGLSLCAEFLKRDFQVFAGQFMPEWPELDRLREKYPARLFILPLDVSREDSVREAARAVAEKTDTVDILVSNAGITSRNEGDLRETLTLDALPQVFSVNSLGGLRAVQYFLPLMRAGMRRLCFVSSEAGTVSIAHRSSGFGYTMSKAALNMAVRLLFNDLQPKGFTFRLYHPGWMRTYMSGKKTSVGKVDAEESAAAAVEQILEDRDWEDRLVMIDNYGEAWPF